MTKLISLKTPSNKTVILSEAVSNLFSFELDKGNLNMTDSGNNTYSIFLGESVFTNIYEFRNVSEELFEELLGRETCTIPEKNFFTYKELFITWIYKKQVLSSTDKLDDMLLILQK